MAGPEQTQRNIVAFNELAVMHPEAVGVLNNKKAIAFSRVNGDEAVVYDTGTYITKENGYKSSPITSASVRNSIIELVQRDYVPVNFSSLSFGKRELTGRQYNRGRAGRPPAAPQARQPKAPVIQKTAMRQFYPHVRVNPANYAHILKEYNEGFASLQKSFDDIRRTKKRGDRE